MKCEGWIEPIVSVPQSVALPANIDPDPEDTPEYEDDGDGPEDDDDLF